MKRWLVYSIVLGACFFVGILLYRDLQHVAQKQENQTRFQQRQENMQKNKLNSIRRDSAVWSSLPDPVQKKLREIGFTPASLKEEDQISISQPRLDGTTGSTEQYRDHWLLINFWATWCPPCRFEMPSMNQLSDEFNSDPLTIIAINLQENREQIQSFVDNMDLRFPVWLDREGTVANRFYVTGVPETWLIAPGGRPVAKMNGSRDWNDEIVVTTFRELTQTDV